MLLRQIMVAYNYILNSPKPKILSHKLFTSFYFCQKNYVHATFWNYSIILGYDIDKYILLPINISYYYDLLTHEVRSV